MKSHFQGKTIWVTGASSGIGRAIALELASYDTQLILSARNMEPLEETRQKCLEKGSQNSNIKLLTLNLLDSFSLAQRAKEAIQLFGQVDILINNAGISHRSSIAETSMEVQRKVMEVNYFGAINLSSNLLNHMLERGIGQQLIVNSIAGKVSLPYRSAYSASKHALVGFYESMQRELTHSGVDITIAYPGYVTTSISINALKGDGSSYGTMDKTQKNGISPTYCAQKILEALAKKKDKVIISGPKERVALLLERFFPSLLAKIVSKSIR